MKTETHLLFSIVLRTLDSFLNSNFKFSKNEKSIYHYIE